MTPRLRAALLGLAGLCLVPGIWKVANALPGFGAATAVYGIAIDEMTPAARHVSNMVTAVNFDYRGFDTLGEEFMLVCAVTGTVLLLRGARGEQSRDKAGRAGKRPVQRRTDAVVLICRIFGPATLIFGLYVVLHAMVTPGGGFQGGVVIASGLVLLYLGEGYESWRKLARSPVLAAIEGGGAFVFALAALSPLLVGAAAMQNVLPLGTFRDMLSGGLMLVENAAVACAVAGGFAILFLEFLEETRALDTDSES